MSKRSRSPVIEYRKEELINKKLLTKFLIKNNVEFTPLNNNYDEFEAVIRVKDFTLDKATGKQILKDTEAVDKIDQMFGMVNSDASLSRKTRSRSSNSTARDTTDSQKERKLLGMSTNGRIDNINTPQLRAEDSIVDNFMYPVDPQDILSQAINKHQATEGIGAAGGNGSQASQSRQRLNGPLSQRSNGPVSHRSNGTEYFSEVDSFAGQKDQNDYQQQQQQQQQPINPSGSSQYIQRTIPEVSPTEESDLSGKMRIMTSPDRGQSNKQQQVYHHANVNGRSQQLQQKYSKGATQQTRSRNQQMENPFWNQEKAAIFEGSMEYDENDEFDNTSDYNMQSPEREAQPSANATQAQKSILKKIEGEQQSSSARRRGRNKSQDGASNEDEDDFAEMRVGKNFIQRQNGVKEVYTNPYYLASSKNQNRDLSPLAAAANQTHQNTVIPPAKDQITSNQRDSKWQSRYEEQQKPRSSRNKSQSQSPPKRGTHNDSVVDYDQKYQPYVPSIQLLSSRENIQNQSTHSDEQQQQPSARSTQLQPQISEKLQYYSNEFELQQNTNDSQKKQQQQPSNRQNISQEQSSTINNSNKNYSQQENSLAKEFSNESQISQITHKNTTIGSKESSFQGTGASYQQIPTEPTSHELEHNTPPTRDANIYKGPSVTSLPSSNVGGGTDNYKERESQNLYAREPQQIRLVADEQNIYSRKTSSQYNRSSEKYEQNLSNGNYSYGVIDQGAARPRRSTQPSFKSSSNISDLMTVAHKRNSEPYQNQSQQQQSSQTNINDLIIPPSQRSSNNSYSQSHSQRNTFRQFPSQYPDKHPSSNSEYSSPLRESQRLSTSYRMTDKSGSPSKQHKYLRLGELRHLFQQSSPMRQKSRSPSYQQQHQQHLQQQYETYQSNLSQQSGQKQYQQERSKSPQKRSSVSPAKATFLTNFYLDEIQKLKDQHKRDQKVHKKQFDRSNCNRRSSPQRQSRSPGRSDLNQSRTSARGPENYQNDPLYQNQQIQPQHNPNLAKLTNNYKSAYQRALNLIKNYEERVANRTQSSTSRSNKSNSNRNNNYQMTLQDQMTYREEDVSLPSTIPQALTGRGGSYSPTPSNQPTIQLTGRNNNSSDYADRIDLGVQGGANQNSMYIVDSYSHNGGSNHQRNKSSNNAMMLMNDSTEQQQYYQRTSARSQAGNQSSQSPSKSSMRKPTTDRNRNHQNSQNIQNQDRKVVVFSSDNSDKENIQQIQIGTPVKSSRQIRSPYGSASRSPKVLNTTNSFNMMQNYSVINNTGGGYDSDDQEGWVNIKDLSMENQMRKKEINEIMNYGKKNVNPRKRLSDAEQTFKGKYTALQSRTGSLVAPKNSRIHSQQIDFPSSPQKNGAAINQNVDKSFDPMQLYIENNLERYIKLSKKKDLYNKYSLISNQTLDKEISSNNKKQKDIESQSVSPVKPSQTARVADMSSTNIMKYHQLKVQKAKLMQVDLVRNQKKRGVSVIEK